MLLDELLKLVMRNGRALPKIQKSIDGCLHPLETPLGPLDRPTAGKLIAHDLADSSFHLRFENCGRHDNLLTLGRMPFKQFTRIFVMGLAADRR
jgi:hypothetical protein